VRTKRRTEITVETDQVLFLRRRSFRLAWCAACAGQVHLVTAEEAAILAGLNLRAIFRRVEADQLHYTETPDGQLLICLNSSPH
jgi:hypothetical protein